MEENISNIEHLDDQSADTPQAMEAVVEQPVAEETPAVEAPAVNVEPQGLVDEPKVPEEQKVEVSQATPTPCVGGCAAEVISSLVAVASAGTLEDEEEELETPARPQAQVKLVESPLPESVDLSQMSLQELLECLEKLSQAELSKELQQAVERVRANFYRKRKAEIEQERQLWVSQGGLPEEFKSTESDVASKFAKLHDAYVARRHAAAEALEAEQKANLEKKLEVLRKIEALTQGQEIQGQTFKEFEALRAEWRSIGHVPRTEAEHLYQSYNHQIEVFYDYVKLDRELRDLDYKKNLEEKTKLCEQAEDLIAEGNVIKAFHGLQELHAAWKEIGPVPHEKNDEIWERFSHATAIINGRHREHLQELKAKFAESLKIKEDLCQKAEQVLKHERERYSDWVADTQQMVELQKQWKASGPLSSKRQDVWDHFQSICQEFFAARRTREKENKQLGKENLQKKTDLCLQAEALQDSTDWRGTTQELIALQKQWKEIGFTPRKPGQELWERFRAAQDHFFDRRSEANKTQTQEYQENLDRKQALIHDLETYDMPDDPKAAIEILKHFQSVWGSIGFVPIKKKDALQKRYREALDAHYSKLHLERKEQRAAAYSSRLDAAMQGTEAEQELLHERRRLDKKLHDLETERTQIENNMGFISTSDNDNPMIAHVQQRVDQLSEAITDLQAQLRAVAQRLQALHAKNDKPETDSKQ
jgi:hypothetical protein